MQDERFASGLGITAVRGIEVGHADDAEALTGCSVVLCREGAVAGVDVRGLAPGTRETDLCRPGMLVDQVQAVLLTGGSAYGLDAATGVVRYLRERGLGYDVGITVVPNVPAAVIFDLGIGEVAWPDAAMGYEACLATTDGEVAQGCIGAGMGATVGKILGGAQATKSGLGSTAVRVGEVTVGAIVAVNALGDVVEAGGRIIAGARDPETGNYAGSEQAIVQGRGAGFGNTTIGVVATDAVVSKEGTNYLARIAHNGLARSIRPVHTLVDGDTIFTLATGQVEAAVDLTRLGVAAVWAVEEAVRNAVRYATPAGGLPAAR